MEEFNKTKTWDIEGELAPLAAACKDGQLEAVQSLLEAGADPNELSPRDKGGYSGLHLAAGRARAEIVKILIENGAIVNAADSRGFTPLFMVVDGCRENNPERTVETAKILLDAGADVNFTTPFCEKRRKYDSHEAGGIYIDEEHKLCGKTPLSWAIYLGLPAAVKLLIDAGADITAKGEDGCTPLAFAAFISTEILKMIFEAGGDVSEPDVFGRTPLHNAARVCNVESVRFLLEAGGVASVPDPSDIHGITPLQLVLHSQPRSVEEDHKNNKIAIVKLLLDSGYDINKINSQYDKQAEREKQCNMHYYCCAHVPLRCALSGLVYDPDTTLMKLLIEEYGADIKIKDPEGGTQLCWAAATGTNAFRIVQFLIQSCANVNERGKFIETPLHHATESHDIRVIEILLGAGADPNAADYRDETPLHYFFHNDCQCTSAMRQGDLRAIEMLLEADANPNFAEDFGLTPLHFACMGSGEVHTAQLSAARLLLEAGANPNIADFQDCTPLQRITHPIFMTTLLEYGAGNVRCSCMECHNQTVLRCYYCELTHDLNHFHHDEREVCNLQNVIVSMEEYYIKVEVSGLRAITNFTDADPPAWWCKREFFRFECNKEFVRMKVKIVGTTDCTYYHVFTQDERAKNPELRDILTREGCAEAFPIYGGLIYAQYVTAVRRWTLIDESKSLFTLAEDLPRLPGYCVEKILNYLREKDLKIVSRVCRATLTGTPLQNAARSSSVESVDVSAEAGDVEVITFTLDGITPLQFLNL